MISFTEAAEILDELVEKLPQEIFEGLNGGVNLIEDVKRGEDGGYILGLYHVNTMGRYVEIFYGTIVELYGSLSREELIEKFKETLHHELTHHIEHRAGDKTLERWDAEQKYAAEPLDCESILFVDDDGAALAPMAAVMLGKLARDAEVEIRVGAACVSPFAGELNAAAVDAARELGYQESFPHPDNALTAAAGYDAVLCMTMAQADAVFAENPKLDERIMCLSDSDIRPPAFKMGWPRTARRVEEEMHLLLEELCGGEK